MFQGDRRRTEDTDTQRRNPGSRCSRILVVALAFTVLGSGLLLAPATTMAGAAGSASGLRGGGSIDEAWLTGARPGDRLTLLRHGAPVPNPNNPGTADALGSLIIRNLVPGSGYQWDDRTTAASTPTFAVLAAGVNPATDSALYTDQVLHAGLNYITMRDGIRLAATVRFPFGAACSAARPCPTVIEYSGYAVAAPTDPIPSLLASALHSGCSGCGDPNLLPDSATDVGAVVARVSGFATVSLQMRGTGCSGGAFDLFGYPSDYDAYDAIEVVAHQDWVAHHKVGMVGISYSGLSQLPAAGTRPPGLAAIAPMSPTDDLFSTGYPGGIYNEGFAAEWTEQRIDDAKPAAARRDGRVVPLSSTPLPGIAQPWTYDEIDAELAASDGTSSTCLANQVLHGQSASLVRLTGPGLVAPGGAGRNPLLFDRRSMRQWATRITVPVFISGAMQDDQTGPQWPALLSAFPATTRVYANLVNGGHIDSTDPQIMSRWLEFLDLYVADHVPTPPDALARTVLDEFTSYASGTSAQAPLPPTRFTTATTVAQAQSEFAAATPRVEVLFDNGAGAVGAGDPQSTYEAGFSQWPPKGVVTTYHFGLGGKLSPTGSGQPGSTSFTLDPSSRPATSLPSNGNPWSASPDWDWTPVPARDAIAFQTPPFTAPTTIVGPATVDLEVESPARALDVQVTVTEVRPSAHQEEYVTSGFLRSSYRAERRDSTSLFTDPTYLASGAGTLTSKTYTLVKIPVDPIVHTFRPGTELRVVISAPGGDRPTWAFATLDHGQQATVRVGGRLASSLVVDDVHGVDATATLPACGSLRGEPCRSYQDEGNQSGAT
jgi:uncharacterized protein